MSSDFEKKPSLWFANISSFVCWLVGSFASSQKVRTGTHYKHLPNCVLSCVFDSCILHRGLSNRPRIFCFWHPASTCCTHTRLLRSQTSSFRSVSISVTKATERGIETTKKGSSSVWKASTAVVSFLSTGESLITATNMGTDDYTALDYFYAEQRSTTIRFGKFALALLTHCWKSL